MRTTPLLAAGAIALALPLTLTGCGSHQASGADVIDASFYPLQWVAEQVAGDRYTVVNLTKPGAEPHDTDLSVKQIGEIGKSALVVYERGMSPYVDDAVKTAKPKRIVDASKIVTLLPSNPDSDTAEESATDPHFWLDPTMLSEVAAAVEAELAKADPDHESTYAANLATLQGKLAALDQDIRTGLASCRITTIVVSHDAFEYFGRRYGLAVAPIAGLSPDAEPSPAHIAELHKLVQSDHITTIFNEELVSPALSQSLAKDLGIQTAVLDPIEGLSDETADEDYLSLMRKNLAALQKANDCS